MERQFITHLAFIYQVIIRNDVYWTRQLSCRGFFWHFLQAKEELNATAENELAKKPFGQTKETNILPEL